MKGIIWLASYPKSGNTWFRAFLANLFNKGNRPVDINKISTPNFSDRQWWDDALGWSSSDFNEDLIFGTRFDVQRKIAELKPPLFFKTHDAFKEPGSNAALFCPSATRCAIYIVRNPLDVALSYANHMGLSTDAAIEKMNDGEARMADNSVGTRPQLSQTLGDWSWHVRSWADAADIKVHVMRYEDMLSQPELAFGNACKFAGLSVTQDKIARAIQNSSFTTLKEQEKASGFKERPRKCPQFFNEGKAGRWKKELRGRQIDTIVKAHRPVMERFGYGLDPGE